MNPVEPEQTTQAMGPLEVFDASVAAVNRGDAAAATAFFADDAVLTLAQHPPAINLVGQQQIGALLQAATAGAMHMAALGDSQVSGDTLTRKEIHTAGALLPPGFSIQVDVEVVVRHGKIQSVNITTPPDEVERLAQAKREAAL